jgi:hypothetical protein
MFMSKIVSVILCFALISVSAGCSSIMEEHRDAAVGGIAGAVIGHGTGAVVAGALIGALVGGAAGHFTYDQQRTREQRAQTYHYQDSQGTVLTIENAYASPPTVRPGDVVDLKMTYAVLHPTPNTKTRITEVREISYRGELVGKPEVNVEQSDGTYTSNRAFATPFECLPWNLPGEEHGPNGQCKGHEGDNVHGPVTSAG